ncbi:MAG: stage IV sporulation protein A [Lachnospiraceae bacterium]|nr:stage IV sporulation protein A [Lachnospiraceae bacterium]
MEGFDLDKKNSFDVYQDINKRTNGEIYLAVVGPVRTGKSTFIKRFMDLMVIPEIKDENIKNRTMDELPQSATGTTVMTTEPKFIPKEAAKIEIAPGMDVKVRLVDCVGYMVKGATGHIENEMERMVRTPWFDYEIPFTKAASVGTKKVITEHSTIAVVVTTDGSFGDIERMNYVEPEELTITQLKNLGKPFIVLLNTVKPYAKETLELAKEIALKNNVTVLPVNCAQLKKEEIFKILENVLYEFPVSTISFYMPKWVEMLDEEHYLKKAIIESIKNKIINITKVKETIDLDINDCEYINKTRIDKTDLSNGNIDVYFDMDEKYYYDVLTDLTGSEIKNEYSLINALKNYSVLKKDYERIESAMTNVNYKGYGVVTPAKEEIILEEPEVIKAGNKYGIKIKAKAPSIHMIKTEVLTEIAPIVGNENQAKDLIDYIKTNGEKSENGIFETNIFGKSIEQIVEEGIKNKLEKLSDETQDKLKNTLEKITNESNGGVICIII